MSTRNRVGLVLAALLALGDLSSPLTLQVPEGQVGPPASVLLVDVVLGVVTLVFVVIAWRTRRRGALQIAAGSRILSALSVIPAFFVGPSPAIMAAASAFVLVAVAAVVLMLSPSTGGLRPTRTGRSSLGLEE